MQSILILGNGISRLSFDKKIKQWPGEIWGCNRIYLDFERGGYGPILTKIAGHLECMIEADIYRRENNYHYRILGNISEHTCVDEPIACQSNFKKDTGLTLVAHALAKGYNVELCGFDLGGWDVFSPNHERMPKNQWVRRWRMLLRRYSSHRIKFWGYDHLPYLLSGRPDDEYSKKYKAGLPHINTPEYHNLVAEWGDDKYRAMLEHIPFLMVKNIGIRTWRASSFPNIKPGEEKAVIEGQAHKMVIEYPQDFIITGGLHV